LKAGNGEIPPVGAEVDRGNPGNRMRVAASPPGKRATTTSPSEPPTAKSRPSGLQAAAGTAVTPPGNGKDHSATRSQTVLLASRNLPSTTFFVIR